MHTLEKADYVLDVKFVLIQTVDSEKGVGRHEIIFTKKRFDFRVRVFMEEPDFGKGVAQLLSLTREKGSLSAAYKSMGMAASKAWKILNRAEADLGVKLVERKSGGKQGGGSHLTPEGEDILNRYENFQKEVAEAVKRSFIKKLWKFRRNIKYHEKKRIKNSDHI